MTNKSYYLTLLLALLPTTYLIAQDFVGFNTSQYAGISGVDIQPASTITNDYKVDAIIGGGGVYFYNNYFKFSQSALRTTPVTGAKNYADFKQKYLTELDSAGALTNVYTHGRVQLPSAMVKVSKLAAMSLTNQVRWGFQAENISQELSKLLYEVLDYTPYQQQTFTSPAVNINFLVWSEVGVGYSREVLQKGRHALFVGTNVKYLTGRNALSFQSENFTYQVDNDSIINLIETNTQYGHSNNAKDFLNSNIKYGGEASSVGTDIGVIYEYRKDNEKDYFIRAGFSIVDIGKIKFAKYETSNDFLINQRSWNISQVDITSTEDFNDTLQNRAIFKQATGEVMSMRLPTAVSVQIDYNFTKQAHISVVTYSSLANPKNKRGLKAINTVTVTPRFDTKWFTIGLPFTRNEFKSTQLGAFFRAGPIIVGSKNFFSMLVEDEIAEADLYAVAKVPIFQKKK